MFLDADDWLTKNACKLIRKRIDFNKFDILYFNIFSVYNNMIRKKRVIKSYKNIKDKFLVYSNDSLRCCCNKEFIKKNNILFPQGVKISEDHIFLIQILNCQPKIELLDEYIYYYLAERNGSATKNWESFIDNQLKSYVYITNTELYKNLDIQKKLYITDLWAYYMFSTWSSLKDNQYYNQYENITNTFIKFYENFDKTKYKKLYGYHLLTQRHLYKFLIKIRNFVYKILYNKTYYYLKSCVFNKNIEVVRNIEVKD